MRKPTRHERAHRLDAFRLSRMVRRRLELWAKKEELWGIQIVVFTKVMERETLFSNQPPEDADCTPFVRLLNPYEEEPPSFRIILRCPKGLVLSGKLADRISDEVSVSINHIIEEREWFPADVS
jgi:hypothetical protein